MDATASAAVTSLQQALAEAEHLLVGAKHPRVRGALSALVQQLRDDEKSSSAAAAGTPPAVVPSRPTDARDPTRTSAASVTSVTRYSWDQSDTELKIYFTLPAAVVAAAIAAAAASCAGNTRLRVCVEVDAEQRRLSVAVVVLVAVAGGGAADATDRRPVAPPCSIVLHPLKCDLDFGSGACDFAVVAPDGAPPGASAASSVAVVGFGPTGHSSGFARIFSPGVPAASPAAAAAAASSPSPGAGQCRLKVKASGDVVVCVSKCVPGPWSDLLDTDDFGKPLALGNGTGGGGSAERARDDPNVRHTASLVTMMQQLYRDGDDTMRKTIAEAWAESRGM
jgi:hypothetical protein